MSTLRSKIDEINGLRYMIDSLEIESSFAKRFLYSQSFITSRDQLEKELDNIETLLGCYKKDELKSIFQQLAFKYGQIHDIQGTIKRISKGELLDDIELFEIKRFAILNQEISELVSTLALSFISIPSLQNVVDILDPDRQNIPHFYIYSSYSPALAALRIEEKEIQLENPEKAEEIRQNAIILEDEIREELSLKLQPCFENLQTAINTHAYLDIAIAKSKQALILNLTKPLIADSKTTYKGLFNPQVKNALLKQNKNFQPIDIELFQSPCLITGINMGGKTVLLKTIGLAQTLFQFGFFVPASCASIAMVDSILVSMGDGQSELSGLSSFASEMTEINKIIQESRSTKRLLVLIDELARTTNPDEGKAIVNATLDILSKNNTCSLITTHYSGLNWDGRRLAVKGLITEKISSNLTIKNINDFIDYTLVEASTNTNQAIQIAKLMGIDGELVTKASLYLKNKE